MDRCRAYRHVIEIVSKMALSTKTINKTKRRKQRNLNSNVLRTETVTKKQMNKCMAEIQGPGRVRA